jgi:hypothetical protein
MGDRRGDSLNLAIAKLNPTQASGRYPFTATDTYMHQFRNEWRRSHEAIDSLSREATAPAHISKQPANISPFASGNVAGWANVPVTAIPGDRMRQSIL